MTVRTHLSWLLAALVAAALSACNQTPSPPDPNITPPSPPVDVGQTDFITVDRGGYSTGVGGSADAGVSAGSAGGGSGSSAGAPSGRTGTVEEADIYRVDQNRLFLLNTYRGFIVYDLNDPQKPKRLGRLPIFGYPIEMFVVKDTVYALLRDSLTVTQGAETGDLQVTRRNVSQLVSIDVSDLSQPKVLKRIDIVGQLSEGVSRKIDSTLYVVSNIPQSYYWPGYPYGDDRKEQAWVYSFNVADPKNVELIERLQIFEGGGAQTYDGSSSSSRWFGGLTISATANTLHVVENWYGWSYSTPPGQSCSVYQSTETAVVSIVDISNPDGHIRLHAKFSTPGSLTDQFKQTYVYDEATKKGYYLGIFALREWSGGNCQYSSLTRNTFETWDVTDGAHPTRVSSLVFGEPDETVRGSTFDLTRKVAYAVTARNIDPLYALDFSDPTHLTVASSIEGLSGDMSVFRLINDNQFLVGIGRDNNAGCENSGSGGTGWASNVAVSLIDVRDLSAIRLVQRKCVALENSEATWSAVTWNLDQAHKMFGLFVDGPNSLVTVPVSYYSKEDAEDGWYWYRPRSAVGLMSFDLSRYDPAKPAAAQTVLKPGATVLHPSGTVERSILFNHEAAGQKHRLMVNLSDTHVSVFNVDNADAPVAQSVIEVAPYHTRVYRFGDYVVDEVQVGGGSWWQPGASEFRVKAAGPGVDDAVALATFTVGRVDRVVQWKNLLLVFRPVGDPTTSYWRYDSSQTDIIAFDLSDPTHPVRRGQVVVSLTSYPWYGFGCGYGWGYWPYWYWGSSSNLVASTDEGLAVLSRSYSAVGVTQRIGFLNLTDADHPAFSSTEISAFGNASQRPTDVLALVSSGEDHAGFFVATRELVTQGSAANGYFSSYRAMANHYTNALVNDWSVNTPGTVIKVFEDGPTTRILSTDWSFVSTSQYGYTSWYNEPRLHLLTRTGRTATLRDTMTLSHQQLGDLVGDSNHLFVNLRPAYWYSSLPEGQGQTVDPVDTLRSIDLSGDRLEVKSSQSLGTYGAQLMGLSNGRLFVNLSGDGVMVLDVNNLEAPKSLHFVPTRGWATHVAFGSKNAYIASGSYGIYEVPLDGPATIARVP